MVVLTFIAANERQTVVVSDGGTRLISKPPIRLMCDHQSPDLSGNVD